MQKNNNHSIMFLQHVYKWQNLNIRQNYPFEEILL